MPYDGQDPRCADSGGEIENAGGLKMLTLIRASRNRDGEWSADDYDVFDGNHAVGRIVLTPQAPPGEPWFWVITVRPESTQNRGYAVSRDQALREFQARWLNPARF